MKYTILFGLLFLIGCKGEEEEMVPETLHTSSTLCHDYRLLCNQKTGEYIVFLDKLDTRYYLDVIGITHNFSTYYPIPYPYKPRNETAQEKANRLKRENDRMIRGMILCADFGHASVFKDSLSAMAIVRGIFTLRTEDSLVAIEYEKEIKEKEEYRNHWVEGFKECK